ncbi:galactose oxidase [Didymella exigua CBS 183.55]|uniref:Galactose oxidase n=1 Tax=Didymella exigua CBS 183.55 TaxID=1150837 RepID=A0A6A5RG67_9PLEO|nr:galactose oxidase [Didymella exigua CBS 183.55]KAF1927331.1 galactose oxidase [Didymella exigua CBS 183.55]
MYAARPLPLPLQEHTTVFLPPRTIAVLGGIIPTNDTSITKTSLRAVPDAFVYSSCTGTWEKISGFPAGEERGSAAVGIYGWKIILAGGMTDLELSGNRSQNIVAVVSMFDMTSRRWKDVSDISKYLPEARDRAGAAVVEDKMYVLDGRERGQENVQGTVFVLDLCDFEAGWKVSEVRMPTPRDGVAAGIVGQKVHIFGGEGNTEAESGIFHQIEVYDTRKDRWENVGTMRTPRHGTYAMGVGKRVYVPGGGVRQSGAPISDFDVFEL